MQQTLSYRFLKDEDARDNLSRWWKSLERNRGDRAKLRRAQRPEDVLLTEAFFNFLREMPATWAKPEELVSSAIVAATLSHVDPSQDNSESFVTRLASPKKAGDKKPRMSELRFQRLLKSRNPEEFFMRLIRAIRLSENKANILSLSESILHWMNEYNKCPDIDPQRRLAVMWASDYYTALTQTK
jgi:CRISPR system Cascade subunit CasB